MGAACYFVVGESDLMGHVHKILKFQNWNLIENLE